MPNRASPIQAAWLAGLLMCTTAAAFAQPLARSIIPLTASEHGMQYLLSLPQGWTPGRKWPIVLAEESADKDFANAMERYVAARGSLPFILVMPYSVTLGASGQRDPNVYPYASRTWDAIDAEGACKFELEGVQRMLDDVRSRYSGEDKVYITGLEAGAHLVWAMAFRYPEQLAAAAPVAGNYRERCMEDGRFSRNPARATLPIQAFIGEHDTLWRGEGHGQFVSARRAGEAHGFMRIRETVVPGRGHEALAPEVLNWFNSLRKER